MLTIDAITYRIAGREILSGASARLPAGRRIGLVGRNGAGKTTLFKLILGQIHADGGEISKPQCLAHRRGGAGGSGRARPACSTPCWRPTPSGWRCWRRPRPRPIRTRLGDIHTRLEAIDAYSAPARAAAILAGLGFSADDQMRPCAEFSGGWRMRVALAAILFAAPDLLLLDEPTNYLDLEGVLWLEDYLKRYRGSVLIISHDRDLLNSVCEFILHLERGKTTLYTGNYDTFSRPRAPAPRQRPGLRQEAGGRTQTSAELRRPLPRQGLQGAPGAKPHQDAGEDGARRHAAGRACRAHPPAQAGQAPARRCCRSIASAVGYEPGKPVLSGISLRFDPEDRIALLGKNGNGKSTLAKLAGRQAGSDGRRSHARAQADARLFRAAPARRTRRRGHPDPDTGPPASQAQRTAVAHAAGRLRLFRRQGTDQGRPTCRAANGRGCSWRWRRWTSRTC